MLILQLMKGIIETVRKQVACWASGIMQKDFSPERIHIPAKEADLSVYIGSGLEKAAVFTERIGELRTPDKSRMLSEVFYKNGWFCMCFDDGFFKWILRTYARPCETVMDGSYACHRIRMTARYPSRPLPEDKDLRRFLLLSLLYGEGYSAGFKKEAEELFLHLTEKILPADRMDFNERCGDAARAAVTLLYS